MHCVTSYNKSGAPQTKGGKLTVICDAIQGSLRCLRNFCPTLIGVEEFFSASANEHPFLSHSSHASNRICCLTYRLFTLVTACIQTFSQPVIIVIGRQSSSWKSSEGTETGSLKNQSLLRKKENMR